MKKLFLIMLLCLVSTKTQLVPAVAAGRSVQLQQASQLNCLTKNIYKEARGEPLEGKIAVALVTLNRLDSGKYGNTICKVVYAPGQFSWTANDVTVKNKEKWQECLYAASVALENRKILGDFDATHFHNRFVRPFWKLKKVAVIGNHTFYR